MTSPWWDVHVTAEGREREGGTPMGVGQDLGEKVYGRDRAIRIKDGDSAGRTWYVGVRTLRSSKGKGAHTRDRTRQRWAGRKP